MGQSGHKPDREREVCIHVHESTFLASFVSTTAQMITFLAKALLIAEQYARGRVV